MFFLEPVYDLIANKYATQVNHFSLIKLIFFSLDKTIFYFAIFIFLRLIWRMVIKKRRTVVSEGLLWIFVFYLILLLMLTTFRTTYFPWQLQFNWNRSTSSINLIFLKQTLKLLRGSSLVDFFYNSVGNIIWFIPFGMLFPNIIRRKQAFKMTLFSGIILSMFIETMQFGLNTGVSDIDDVFFNVMGIVIGYWIIHLFRKVD